jgi:cell division protease FtsH
MSRRPNLERSRGHADVQRRGPGRDHQRAAIIATLANKEFVEMEDLEEARDKVKFGRARKSRKVEEEERVGTAYHEAGHAVVGLLLPEADPLHKVTIIPRGQAMGATFSLPEKDRYGYGRKFIDAELRRLCAGRIAEEKKTGDVTSGAAMDIKMATRYARHMITEWGMSDRLGFVNLSGEDEQETRFYADRSIGDETQRIIDEEVKRLIDEAYRDAQSMIDDNWDKIELLSNALLKYETLSADEVRKILAGEELRKPSVSEILEAEAAKAEKPKKPESTREDPDFGASPPPLPA